MTAGRRKYTVGFIEIGKMGLPMASRIAAHGYPLHAYAISAAAIKEFCNWVAYARAAKTSTEMGQS
jgi:3-hydroxyisobutyrate dehydrogenase-like beta-hydroxyacid dehydrogenase